MLASFTVAADTVSLSPHCRSMSLQERCMTMDEHSLSILFCAKLVIFQIHCDTEGLLLEQLWSLACNCLHQVTCTAAAKCLAGIVNRMPDGETNKVYRHCMHA